MWEYTKHLNQKSSISQRPHKIFQEQTLPENHENDSLYEDSLFNNNVSYIKKERPKSSTKLNVANKRKNCINDNNYEINELKKIVLDLQSEIKNS